MPKFAGRMCGIRTNCRGNRGGGEGVVFRTCLLEIGDFGIENGDLGIENGLFLNRKWVIFDQKF